MKKSIAEKYSNVQRDIEKKVNTGKMEGLSYSDLMAVCSVGKELLKKHAVKTFIKPVADYFESFGFLVTREFDNVNYVIVEA